MVTINNKKISAYTVINYSQAKASAWLLAYLVKERNFITVNTGFI